MKSLILIIFSLMAISDTNTSIHQFSIQALNSDETIEFSDFKGKKILVVNVASKCGYTKQYAELEKLYREYSDKLVVIGFPCNQFLGQEPGSEAEIAAFCSSKYDITFPMTTKIKVKGKDQHEIYQWLTSKDHNGVGNFKISWNFNKFLLDEEGALIGHYASGVKPFDEDIVKHLR